MSASKLSARRILILATDGFEQSELEVPQKELAALGATVHVAAPKTGSIKGWNHTDWGNTSRSIGAVQADAQDDYALVLPGRQTIPTRCGSSPRRSSRSRPCRSRQACGGRVPRALAADRRRLGKRPQGHVVALGSYRLEERGRHRGRRVCRNRPRHHHEPKARGSSRLRRSNRFAIGLRRRVRQLTGTASNPRATLNAEREPAFASKRPCSDASVDVPAGVHIAAGSPGAKATAAPDSFPTGPAPIDVCHAAGKSMT